jgi:hypothetical protein
MKTKRVHITSSGPRCGTTLLIEAMRVCYNFDFVCQNEANISQSNISFGSDHNKILTKRPGELPSIRLPLWFNNNLYIICIIRDPRDMVVSKHKMYPEKYYCSMKYWTQFYTYYKKLEGHPRVLFILYEDLTNNPNRTQGLISKFLWFLKEEKKFSEYHNYATSTKTAEKALNSIRPIKPTSIGNWKEHKERIANQLLIHGDITESLIHFGYENNFNWKNELPVGNGKFEKNHLSEKFSGKDNVNFKTKEISATLKFLLDRYAPSAENFIKEHIPFRF